MHEDYSKVIKGRNTNQQISQFTKLIRIKTISQVDQNIQPINALINSSNNQLYNTPCIDCTSWFERREYNQNLVTRRWKHLTFNIFNTNV